MHFSLVTASVVLGKSRKQFSRSPTSFFPISFLDIGYYELWFIIGLCSLNLFSLYISFTCLFWISKLFAVLSNLTNWSNRILSFLNLSFDHVKYYIFDACKQHAIFLLFQPRFSISLSIWALFLVPSRESFFLRTILSHPARLLHFLVSFHPTTPFFRPGSRRSLISTLEKIFVALSTQKSILSNLRYPFMGLLAS